MTTPHFDFHHTVSPDEIDAQAHVHNLRYLQWSLWAARDHVADLGWDAAAGLARGVGWVVRDHEISYRWAAVAGDQVVVRTWVDDIRRYAITRRYLITRPADQTVLARVKTRWVFVDLRVHKALGIPAEAVAGVTRLTSPPPPPWDDRS